MSTIVIIDHGVVGDRAVERRVLETAGYDVIDTQALGLSVEEAFDLAVERDAVAILAGPIIPLDRAHLERLSPAAPSCATASGSTTSTSTRRRSSGSPSATCPSTATRRSPTTRSRCCWRSRASCSRSTPRCGAAAPASPRRSRSRGCRSARSGSSATAASAAAWRERRGRSAWRSSRTTRTPGTADGVELLELDELLRRADILSLHVPLTPETRHMIGARELALLEPGSLVINIGRGGLVDEDALVAALHSGHIAGAALDVTEIEPLPLSSPLLDAPNVILTPHVAWVSDVALEDLERLTAENALRLIGARELVTV